MIRKLLFGACIGGLIMGQVYEAPQEQQAKEQRLWQNTQSSNDKTRALAEGELLRLAHNKGISNAAQAEAIYLQILASNPNKLEAHLGLAKIYLKRWDNQHNSANLELGLQHLRKSKELALQDSETNKNVYIREADREIVKNLEKIEEQVNQGIPSYNWKFPGEL